MTKVCNVLFIFFLFVSSKCFTINTNSTENPSSINTNVTNDNNNNPQKHLVEIKCTSNCICDHYGGLRRASCNNKRMIFLKDNVPRKSEILEFTQNYLSNIRNDEFHDNELEDLKVLNLSSNKIGEIGIFAFENLNQLKILDLSHNAMQYILAEWFWNLDALEELYLKDNNLGALKEPAPLFESHSLKILDLANCQISYISQETFTSMLELQSLDVSGNHIIDFKPSLIAQLPNLQRINFEANPIKCADLSEVIIYLDNNSIGHKDDCNSDVEEVEDFNIPGGGMKKQHKFEKIMDGTEDNTGEENKVETSWIFEETITDQGVKQIECTPLHSGLLWEIIEMSPIGTLIVTGCFGFLIGIIIGCTCACGRKPKVKRRKNVKSMHRVSRSFSIIRNGPVIDREYLINQEF